MEWIKVKTSHIFHEGFTATTGWAWIKIMALVAEIESIPTEKQILNLLSNYEYSSLKVHFISINSSIDVVLNRVQLDVDKVKAKRSKDNQRNAQVSIKPEKIARDSQEIREVDKSRLDKSRLDIGEVADAPSITTVFKKSFQPPTLEQVTEYCAERKNSVSPEKWMAHYESNGWLVGKNKMKNWKAAVRTWEPEKVKQIIHPWEDEERKKKEALDKYYTEHPEEKR